MSSTKYGCGLGSHFKAQRKPDSFSFSHPKERTFPLSLYFNKEREEKKSKRQTKEGGIQKLGSFLDVMQVVRFEADPESLLATQCLSRGCSSTMLTGTREGFHLFLLLRCFYLGWQSPTPAHSLRKSFLKRDSSLVPGAVLPGYGGFQGIRQAMRVRKQVAPWGEQAFGSSLPFVPTRHHRNEVPLYNQQLI